MRYPLDHMKIRPLQFGADKPLTNTFGMVRKTASNQPRPHQGWDLEAASGTPVYAVADGEARYGLSQSYGHTVTLKFSYKDKTYYAFYAHLAPMCSPMFADRSVQEGTVLGYTGMSGNAAGIPAEEAHLHF
jgi:murein DD-endopeptidase MepM/ murein hydrolase activator NlpD